ncbi:MAG: helix-turn-helix domain-containing protein [Christensenellales bacterium]
MQASCDLLREIDYTIAKIALRVGYPTHHHFSKTFRRFFVCTPKQYRESLNYWRGSDAQTHLENGK